MKLSEELTALTVIIVAFFALCGFLVYAKITADTYPQDPGDCPPQHVYIAHGETPQAGCWPEGAARELGVWPKP